MVSPDSTIHVLLIRPQRSGAEREALATAYMSLCGGLRVFVGIYACGRGTRDALQ
jgi:hypothetical protein